MKNQLFLEQISLKPEILYYINNTKVNNLFHNHGFPTNIVLNNDNETIKELLFIYRYFDLFVAHWKAKDIFE